MRYRWYRYTNTTTGHQGQYGCGGERQVGDVALEARLLLEQPYAVVAARYGLPGARLGHVLALYVVHVAGVLGGEQLEVLVGRGLVAHPLVGQVQALVDVGQEAFAAHAWRGSLGGGHRGGDLAVVGGEGHARLADGGQRAEEPVARGALVEQPEGSVGAGPRAVEAAFGDEELRHARESLQRQGPVFGAAVAEGLPVQPQPLPLGGELRLEEEGAPLPEAGPVVSLARLVEHGARVVGVAYVYEELRQQQVCVAEEVVVAGLGE